MSHTIKVKNIKPASKQLHQQAQQEASYITYAEKTTAPTSIQDYSQNMSKEMEFGRGNHSRNPYLSDLVINDMSQVTQIMNSMINPNSVDKKMNFSALAAENHNSSGVNYPVIKEYKRKPLRKKPKWNPRFRMISAEEKADLDKFIRLKGFGKKFDEKPKLGGRSNALSSSVGVARPNR